jgi:hypothetical protein
MLLDPGGLPITKTPWVDERARIRDAQDSTVTDHQLAGAGLSQDLGRLPPLTTAPAPSTTRLEFDPPSSGVSIA